MAEGGNSSDGDKASVKFNDFIDNGRLKREFIVEHQPIGIGSFGVVVKAKNKFDDKYYAIKKIIIRNYDDFIEKIKKLKIWAEISSDLFIQYKSQWIEKLIEEQQDNFIIDLMRELDTNFHLIPDAMLTFKQDNEITNFSLLHIQMDLCDFSLREGMKKYKSHFNVSPKALLPDLGFYIASELLIEILNAINFLHNLKPMPIIHIKY